MLAWWLLTLMAMVSCQEGNRICPSIDIRNKPERLDQLRGCRVVEGYVSIVLMERGNETDFNQHSLPELREITEYLMFYRVVGLRRIGQIFPNLTVIRGDNLFEDYALIVYEMINLQEVGLTSLTDIMRGAVRIEKNPSLCYVQTVDWDLIAKWDPLKNQIGKNKDSVSCPGCDTSCPQGLCWSRNHCQVQNTKNSGCHPLCVGGCAGPGPRGCYTCRKYFTANNECVNQCPHGTYQYLNRRCITKAECLSIRPPKDNLLLTHQDHNFVIFNGTCLHSCPPGYEMDSEAKSCVPCHGGKCNKWCPGSSIQSIVNAQALRGCTHIVGSLEISIKEGKPKIIAQELEDNLGAIEEIQGCLKVIRSFPIINLNFLKNLTTIQGEGNDNCAMLVMENQNLQDLWDWEKKPNFKILKNRLFFHYNPKLCLHHILKLIEIVHQENVTNLEVDKSSNGDKFHCNAATIEVSVIYRTFSQIQIHIPYIKTESQNSFLRFEIHYMKNPGNNVSIFDDIDQCSDYTWRTKDISVDIHDELFISHGLSVNLTELEPNMEYGYYVKAYTVDRIVGSSTLQTETTLPSTPTEPVSVQVYSNSPSEIALSWVPPRQVNGKLDEFVVTWTLLDKDDSIIRQRDYCIYPMIYVAEPLTAVTEIPKTSSAKTSCCFKVPTNIPEDDFEHLCSNFGYHSFPVGFPDIKPSQTCDSYFNKYLYLSAFKQEREDKSAHKHKLSLNKKISATNKIKTNTEIRRLPANALNYTIRNTKHFHDYIVTVKACREKHPEEPDQSEDHRCSKTVIVNVRTQKDNSADVISGRISHKVVNKTLYVSWEAPLHPNGFVVAFELEYRQRDVFNPKTINYCVPYLEYTFNKKTFTILDLLPGKYEFRIRAVSLSGKGPYTEFEPFTVSREFTVFDRLIFTVIIIFIVTLLMLGILLSMYIQKKKSNLDGILIASVNPDYHYPLDQWELQKEDIVFGREIGFGTFGKVYEGVLHPNNILCAVKTVSENATMYDKNIFLNEASIMKSVSGAYHIVQLMGVVSREKPPLVVMELMSLGDLRTYLMSVRSTNVPSIATKLRMAAQIADGMCFMEAKKFVHRDLAARNCLINGDFTVKVGDFGMTRDIYETDYYRKGDKGLLPIRWMAPESLKDGLFTSQSDVWSYGVVLWEIVTMGEQPYQGLSNEVVLREVMSGRVRLDIPSLCPNPLKILLMSCWRMKPAQRINFMQVVGSLEYYVDDQFKNVSFYHSEEAVSIRKSMSDYVQMGPVEDQLLTEDPEKSVNGGIAVLLSRSPCHKFSLKLKTVPEDPDSSAEDL